MHYFGMDGVKTTSIKNEITWDEVRVYRNRCLIDTDMWMLADRWASLSEAQQTELTEYRQAMRDITDTDSDAWDAVNDSPDAPSWTVAQ